MYKQFLINIFKKCDFSLEFRNSDKKYLLLNTNTKIQFITSFCENGRLMNRLDMLTGLIEKNVH